MTRLSATAAHNRAYGALYAHLRDWHGIAPGVLGRSGGMRHLEAVHHEIAPDCEWEGR